jgi:hypothetical protein
MSYLAQYIDYVLQYASYDEIMSFEQMGLVFQVSVDYRFADGSYKHHKLEILLRALLLFKSDCNGKIAFGEELFLALFSAWKNFNNEDINSCVR